MKLTAFPRPMPIERYEPAIARMVERLCAQDGVRAVYQVGGIRSPGISDVDLLVVFADDANCRFNPLHGLDADESYLFPHAQFGLTERHFRRASRYGFFHDYQLRAGGPIASLDAPLTGDEARLVRQQSGLEYLVKMFINISIERAYGIVRIRNLLLMARALLYDLEDLGVKSGPVVDLVQQVIDWRTRWFVSRPSDADLERWFEAFAAELGVLIRSLCPPHSLCVPADASLRISANVEIVAGAPVRVEHRGIVLPSALGDLGRKYFNIQHRFNRFTAYVPLERAAIPPILRARHALVAEMTAHNRQHLPHFMPVSTALAIFGPVHG